MMIKQATDPLAEINDADIGQVDIRDIRKGRDVSKLSVEPVRWKAKGHALCARDDVCTRQDVIRDEVHVRHHRQAFRSGCLGSLRSPEEFGEERSRNGICVAGAVGGSLGAVKFPQGDAAFDFQPVGRCASLLFGRGAEASQELPDCPALCQERIDWRPTAARHAFSDAGTEPRVAHLLGGPFQEAVDPACRYHRCRISQL